MPRSEKPGMSGGSPQEKGDEQLPEYERRFREDAAKESVQEQIIAHTTWLGRFRYDDSVPQEAKDRVIDVLTGLRGAARHSREETGSQGYTSMSDEDVERSRLRLMVDSEGRLLGDPQVERMLTLRWVEGELARREASTRQDESEDDPTSRVRQTPPSGQQGAQSARERGRTSNPNQGGEDVVDAEYDEIRSDGTRVHHGPGHRARGAEQGGGANRQQNAGERGREGENQPPEWVESLRTIWEEMPRGEARVEALRAWVAGNVGRFGRDIDGRVARAVAAEIDQENQRLRQEQQTATDERRARERQRDQQDQDTRDARRRQQDRQDRQQERDAAREPEGELDPLDDILLDEANAGRLTQLARGYQRGAPRPMWETIVDVIQADAESRGQVVDLNRLRARGENHVWNVARDIYLGRLAGPEAVAIRQQIVQEVGSANPNVERVNGLNQRLNDALARGLAEWRQLSNRRMDPELVGMVDQWIHRGTEAPRAEALPQDVDEVRASITRLVQEQLRAKPGKIGADDLLYAHVGLTRGPFAAQAIPEKLCRRGVEIAPNEREDEMARLKLWVSVLRQMHDIMVDVKPSVTGGAQDLYKPWAEKLTRAKEGGSLESFDHREYELFAQFEIRVPPRNGEPGFFFTIEGKDFAAQQMMALARLAEGDPRRMNPADRNLYNQLGLGNFSSGTFDPENLIQRIAGMRFRNSHGQVETLNDFTARRVYEFLEMHEWRSRLGPNGGMANPLAGGEQFGRWGDDKLSIGTYVHSRGHEIGRPRRMGSKPGREDQEALKLETWIQGFFKNGMLNMTVGEGEGAVNGYQLAESGQLFSSIARGRLREGGRVTPLSNQWDQIINSLGARELFLATLSQPDKAIGSRGAGISGSWIGNMLSIGTALAPYGKEAAKRAKLVALGFAVWNVSVENITLTLEGLSVGDRVVQLYNFGQEMINNPSIFGDYNKPNPKPGDFTKDDVEWFAAYVNEVRQGLIDWIDYRSPLANRGREQGMITDTRKLSVKPEPTTAKKSSYESTYDNVDNFFRFFGLGGKRKR